MTLPNAIQDFAGQPLTSQILMHLLKDYKRPFDKIGKLVRQKALIQVKRGIFIPGPALNIPQPEPFLLANHIAGPSYVSLEAALSHWRMIPEEAYEITSVITGGQKPTIHPQDDSVTGIFPSLIIPSDSNRWNSQRTRLLWWQPQKKHYATRLLLLPAYCFGALFN